MRVLLVFCLICGLCFCSAPVLASAPPGGTGYVTFNCDVEGASVYLDGNYVGAISGGSLDVPDGNLYTTYTIKKDGYYDNSGSISFLPGGSENIEITVTLNLKPVGSGKGWFTVHSNIDGASVAFDGVTKGTTASGVFTVEVTTTGTPYTTFSVSRSGYVTYDGSISRMPASGETIDLYATLNPVPTTSPTTVPAPIGGDAGWYAIHSNVNDASVYFDSAYKGAMANGVLTVPVYSTGTPYTTYRVEKSGYVSQSGSLSTAPAKGQTKDIYVTLNPVPTPVPVPVGAGKGYYAVHCNVNGAEVYFDGTYHGVITNGILSVMVATTGTPFRTIEVKKSGYTPYTSSITQYPAAEQTIDLYTSLSPAPVKTTVHTTVPTAVPPTESPVPFPVTIGALLAAIGLWGTYRISKNK